MFRTPDLLYNAAMSFQDLLNPFNASVYYKTSCDSTMSEMASLENPEHGTVVYTSFQSKGRGRGRNRSWLSPSGDSLLFTVVVDPQKTVHPPVRIPLICALALEEMLKDDFAIKSQLKWPNDILINGKKISGILCEYSTGKIFAGIGLNLKQKGFSDDIKNLATSITLESSFEPGPEEVLESFLRIFKSKLESSQWKEKAEGLLYGKDRILDAMEGGTENQRLIKIRIIGLDDDGFLIIKDMESGQKKVLKAGEISFQGFGDFR